MTNSLRNQGATVMYGDHATSRGSRAAAALAAALVAAQLGCLEAPEDGAAAGGGEVEPAHAALLTDDLTGATARTGATVIVPRAGTSLGSVWSPWRYCPEGSFAAGYHQRVQPGPTQNTDDTGVNAIELECMDGLGNVAPAMPHPGYYGTWTPGAMCASGSWVTGAGFRLPPTGGIPETQTTGLETDCTTGVCREKVGFLDTYARCSDGKDIRAQGGWTVTDSSLTKATTCPAGKAVCGLRVQYNTYWHDVQGMEGLQLACCPTPSPISNIRVTDRKTPEGLLTRTFTGPGGTPRTPLVLVEGFDIEGTYDVDTISMLVGLKTDPTLIGRLLDVGYSVTFVDLGTGNWDSIQTNARRVGALVNTLWNESAKIKPIKLVGASMGGLIVATTTALRYYPDKLSEANPGWTFEVDHVTTMDTPHGGVYIPQALFHLMSRFQRKKAAANLRYRAFTSKATKQMSYLPYDAGWVAEHVSWQGYYAKVLDALRRSDIRLVSVVNGSWNGAPQYSDWTPGYLNVRYRDGDDVDAQLYTQVLPAPKPGGLVAKIKTAGPFLDNETKEYWAFAGPLVENLPGGYTDHWLQLAKVLDIGAPKFGRHSFVPTWSSAGIPYEKWLALPANQQTSLSALETAQGPLASSALSPFDRILRTNANNEHPFVPKALFESFIEELRVANTPPSYAPIWTGWLNRDVPDGNGDGEHFGLFTGMPCKAPLTAECRRRSDGVDWARTGEVMRCTAAGSNCLKADQPDGQCDDYEVRFACPNPASVGPWLDRDDPTGAGDGEHLGLLVQEYGTCAEPIGIECQTTSGVDVAASGEVVRCQANLGLECLHELQSDFDCQDYQVRFACPTGGAWTPWTSRDTPGGQGDGEALHLLIAEGKTCARPLAAECRRKSDKLDWKLAGQNMVCSAAEGGICLNARQGAGFSCADYEVRFFCPGAWPQR